MILFQKINFTEKTENVWSMESLHKISLFGDQADFPSKILLEKINLPSVEKLCDQMPLQSYKSVL